MKAIIYLFAMAFLSFGCEQKAPIQAAQKQAASDTAANVVELTDIQLKNAGVITGNPEMKNMHGSITAGGVLDVPPQNIVSVGMPLGGYVTRILLIPGSQVKKGTLLATMEDQQYIQLQQDYLTAKSRMQFLEADFNRQQSLNENKASSDKTFQLAKADFDAQKILVKSLSEKLKLIGLQPEKINETNISRTVNIYSPIKGFVTKVNVNIGKYVNPSDIILEIINPEDLHVKLTIFENDAANLRAGQKISFTTNDRSERTFTGKVILMTPNIEDNRSTEVHCHIEGESSGLIAGTSVNATIEVENREVVAVPDDAIVTWENRQYVFLSTGMNRFSIFPIETGLSHEGFTEVKNKLPSANLVIHKAYTVLMKMKNAGDEG